jgi:hypothetical protein
MINLEDLIPFITFRWTSWGVESSLADGEASTKFKQRATYDYIVLFDEDSYENNLKPGNCLFGLKQAIFTVKEIFFIL